MKYNNNINDEFTTSANHPTNLPTRKTIKLPTYQLRRSKFPMFTLFNKRIAQLYIKFLKTVDIIDCVLTLSV